jgi:hypothetical protein
MISGFKSRVFGFGLEMSEDELEQVNSKRRRGQTYKSYAGEAHNFLTGSRDKKEFKESPFVRMITYGNAQDGYWGSNHMLVQVQDILDVWNTLERTSYMQPICEFDHSSGHDCERDDGLTVSPTHLKMNWGKGRMMRDCELTAGCLGTIEHDDRVYAGSTYSHTFTAGNPPKFLDGNEVPPELDVVLEANCLQRKKRKDELVQDLEAGGYNGKGGVVDLKARCIDAGIPTMKTEDRIKPGYVNKPKGAYDIAYELGWIDANKRNSEGNLVSWQGAIIREPAVAGAPPDQPQGRQRRGTKPTKRRDLKTSLRFLLGNCEHFKNEKTKLAILLEWNGGICRMTPKCHPEIAGVGIEYDWGYAKLTYRKRINDGVAAHLEANVKKALSTKDVLTINRTRKFARKARDYKLTYFYLFQMVSTAIAEGGDGRVAKQAIEKIVKAFKVHRCALDSDYAFITHA